MATEDLGKFLEEEGLNLQGFDQWLESQDPSSNQDPNVGRRVFPTDARLLLQLLEGVKGKSEAEIIISEIANGTVFLESTGQLLQTLRYSRGTFRAPGPMIRLGEKIHGNS